MKNQANNILSDFTTTQLDQIAERIKYLRVNVLELSQSQFSSLVKLSQTHLSLIENKKKHIGPKAILQISAATNAKLEWMIYGDDEAGIFHSDLVSKDQLLKLNRASILADLQKTFSLKKSELSFVEYYLNLSSKDRYRLIQSLEAIKDLL